MSEATPASSSKEGIHSDLPPSRWCAFIKTAVGSKRKWKQMAEMVGMRLIQTGVLFLKEMLITRAYGLCGFLDAYTLTNNLVGYSRNLTEHLSYNWLIPAYAKAETNHNYSAESPSDSNIDTQTSPEAGRVITVLMHYVFLASVALSIVCFVFYKPLAAILAGHWSHHGERWEALLAMMMVIVPMGLLTMGVELIRGLSIQQRRFMLLYVPRTVSTLLFIAAFLWAQPIYGQMALLWTFSISMVADLALHWWLLPVTWQGGKTIAEVFKNNFTLPGGKALCQQLAPTFLSWIVFSASILIDNVSLSYLPEGDPAAYRYAFLCITMLSFFTVQQLGNWHLSEMTEACTQHNFTALRKRLTRYFIRTVVLGAGLWLLLYWTPPLLVSLLFQRGAFTADNVARVSGCMQIMLLALPYLSAWRMLNSVFHTLRSYKAFILIVLASNLLRIPMNHWGLQFGIDGLAWMTTANNYLCVGMLLFSLWLQFHKKPVLDQPVY